MKRIENRCAVCNRSGLCVNCPDCPEWVKMNDVVKKKKQRSDKQIAALDRARTRFFQSRNDRKQKVDV